MQKSKDGPLMSVTGDARQRRDAINRLAQQSSEFVLERYRDAVEGDAFETQPLQWATGEQAQMLRQLADLIEAIEVPLQDVAFEFTPRPVESYLLSGLRSGEAGWEDAEERQTQLKRDDAKAFLMAWKSLLEAHHVEHVWYDDVGGDYGFCGWRIPLGELGKADVTVMDKSTSIEWLMQQVRPRN